jgi:hypothetical protein
MNTFRGDSYDEFAEFVKNELGDIVPYSEAYTSKKLVAYAVFWIWSRFYKTFNEMFVEFVSKHPDHATYEVEGSTPFVVDRRRQYEKIYNHRQIKQETIV